MADALTVPVTLSAWAEEDVRVADVLAALDDLRKPEPMPATRTSVLTLVVVATRASSADRALAALHELGGRHPARVLTIIAEPGAAGAGAGAGASRIDARVRLLGGEAAGRQVWFEDVELVAHGQVTAHLDSLIEPFTVADLPVVAWFVDGLPATDDPLLAAADVVLVDARDFGDTECFAPLVQVARRRPVVDLSWYRLQPWRELMAGLFEGPDARPFLADVRSARVAGRTGPRHLLGGWLADRLRLPSPEVHLVADDHVSMRIVAAASDARMGVFEVVRRDDERVVRARADLEGGPTAEAVVPLPDDTPAWGLANALSHLHRDHVYEHALRAAVALLESRP